MAEKQQENKKRNDWKKIKEHLSKWGRVVVPIAVGTVAHATISDTPNEDNNLAPKVDEITNVSSVDVLTNEQRNELIETFAREDAQKYTRIQGEYLHDDIKQIMEYTDKYEEAEARIFGPLEEYRDQIGYYRTQDTMFDKKEKGEITKEELRDALNKLDEAFEKDEKVRSIRQQWKDENLTETPTEFANRITGLGKGNERYCVAIQTNAMRNTEKDMNLEGNPLKEIRDGVGWTVEYATQYFTDAGFADKYSRMADFFTINEHNKAIVKVDDNGNPLVKDGDLALVDGHCIRLNVSEEGVVTFSSGNAERIEQNIIGYRYAKNVTVAHIEDYATYVSKQRYQSMTNEELMALDNRRHNQEKTITFDDALKVSGQEYIANLPTADAKKQSIFKASLARDAKHTLDGTLPMSCSQELRDWENIVAIHLDKKIEQHSSRDKNNEKHDFVPKGNETLQSFISSQQERN